jgi:hypothetical protein
VGLPMSVCGAQAEREHVPLDPKKSPARRAGREPGRGAARFLRAPRLIAGALRPGRRPANPRGLKLTDASSRSWPEQALACFDRFLWLRLDVCERPPLTHYFSHRERW